MAEYVWKLGDSFPGARFPGTRDSLLFFISGFPGIKHAKFPGKRISGIIIFSCAVTRATREVVSLATIKCCDQ
jgi:hypothetical protein